MLLLQLLQLLQQLLQLQSAAFGDKNYDSEDSAKSVGGVGSGRGIGLIKKHKTSEGGGDEREQHKHYDRKTYTSDQKYLDAH